MQMKAVEDKLQKDQELEGSDNEDGGLEFIDPKQERLAMLEEQAKKRLEDGESQPRMICVNGQFVPVSSMGMGTVKDN